MTNTSWPEKAAREIEREQYEAYVDAREFTSERIASIIAAHAEPLVAELADIRNEWESCCSREASTFAELKERREQVVALVALLRESKREHTESDAYCPKSEPDGERDTCYCGADEWNKKIDEVLR